MSSGKKPHRGYKGKNIFDSSSFNDKETSKIITDYYDLLSGKLPQK